ncbi:hypothetical protein R5R73_11845 [Salinicola sp. LHM]|uniref:hypothetical protein n=1 Tax=Salinicola TaxID=404432 RepID=UPI000B403D3D|nr:MULTISPECIES: hypothetical protein [Salinicola]MDF3919426.1 hypothetical protein [Salinicola salarius]WQH31752.1 hypothetical protein R5R73_11845 [Salinicola sp. LHM]
MMQTATRTPVWMALAGLLTLGALAGCASDSSSIEKDTTDYVVTGLGDDQDEALANAKERALEQCESQDRDEFVIVEQDMMGPKDGASKAANANDQLEGATVDEDTELQAATQEGDGYKATWTIRCR